jgi:hypothetical protein
MQKTIESRKKHTLAQSQLQALDVDIKTTTQNKLVFKKMNFKMWFIGAVFLLSGIVLLYFVLAGIHTKGFHPVWNTDKSPKSKWWHYLTPVGVIILGFSFVYAGKIRIIEFDTELQ